MWGLRPYDILLILLGTGVILFGLAAGRFHVRLPGLTEQVKKPLPRWFGRLWFFGGGVLLIYLGLKR